MSTRELDAARISDPHLRESYERCRELNAAHGKTYYLATLLLPAGEAALRARALRVRPVRRRDRRRPRVDADRAGEGRPGCGAWGQAFLRRRGPRLVRRPGLPGGRRHRAAVGHPAAHFEAFLHSMTMDLTVTEYRDLRRPLRVRLRLGRRHRPADGPDPRADVAGGLRPGHRPRRRLPARQLRARRRRGPRPRAASTSRSTSWRQFGVTRADLEQRVATPAHQGGPRLPDRARARRSRSGRARASTCCTRRRATASRPPGSCTAASSTRSSASDYEVFTSGPRCRCAAAGGRRARLGARAPRRRTPLRRGHVARCGGPAAARRRPESAVRSTPRRPQNTHRRQRQQDEREAEQQVLHGAKAIRPSPMNGGGPTRRRGAADDGGIVVLNDRRSR